MNTLNSKIHYLFGTVLFCVFLSSCSMIAISDYDQATMDHLADIRKKIDRLYTELRYTSPSQRGYSEFESQYLDIDVELQSLLSDQRRRPLNDLTVKQVEITKKLWSDDRADHIEKNTVSDFFISRRQKEYNRLLNAIMTGEDSKVRAN